MYIVSLGTPCRPAWHAANNAAQLAPQYIPRVDGLMGIGSVTEAAAAAAREVRLLRARVSTRIVRHSVPIEIGKGAAS